MESAENSFSFLRGEEALYKRDDPYQDTEKDHNFNGIIEEKEYGSSERFIGIYTAAGQYTAYAVFEPLHTEDLVLYKFPYCFDSRHR